MIIFFLCFFMVNFLYFITYDYSFECVILQFIIIFLFVLFINTNNNYYSLLYLFLIILFLGSVLCLLNNELTAGFLWVGEILVIFVFLLLILYVNVHGESQKNFTRHNFFLIPFFFFVVLFLNNDTTLIENDLLFLHCDLYWVDYYEALNDYNNNDLFGFFISYYVLNSIVLMLFALILFFGSIICVLLFRTIKVVKFSNVNNFLDTIKFSQNFLYSIFMRKQDLFDQNSFFASLKTIFSKND